MALRIRIDGSRVAGVCWCCGDELDGLEAIQGSVVVDGLYVGPGCETCSMAAPGVLRARMDTWANELRRRSDAALEASKGSIGSVEIAPRVLATVGQLVPPDEDGYHFVITRDGAIGVARNAGEGGAVRWDLDYQPLSDDDAGTGISVSGEELGRLIYVCGELSREHMGWLADLFGDSAADMRQKARRIWAALSGDPTLDICNQTADDVRLLIANLESGEDARARVTAAAVLRALLERQAALDPHPLLA